MTRISDTRAVLQGSLAHNKTRTLMCVCAIALGVALGYGVQLINQAAVNELAAGVQTLSGSADLEVRGPRNGFDEMLYPVFARAPQVRVASPVVEVDARLSGRDESLRILGIDVFRAGYLQPGLVATASEPLALLRSDALFLSPAAATALAAHAGDTLTFQVGLREVALRVSGVLGAGGQQRYAVMDIAGAQQAFDRAGRISRVDLRLRPGVDLARAQADLRALLPAGMDVAQPQTTLAASASLSRSYRVNLDVLALVALFTGGLLVFSAQALSVVRRRAQFALLRVLGVTRGRLLALIVADGMWMGVAGSAIGLAAGYGMAQVALRVVGADLGSGYFRGLAPSLAIDPVTAAIFFALGVAAAVLGCLVPALEAVRAPIAPALRAGDEQRAFVRMGRWWPGTLMMVAGLAATGLPPVAGLPLFGYASIALLLLGTLMLMPRAALLVLRALPTPRAPALQLACAQLRGSPGQAMVSLATIVASVSLLVSMAIMVTSFRDSLAAWLEHVLPADAYVRAGGSGDTVYLDAPAQAAIAALPQVRRAEFGREQQILLDPARPRVSLLARSLDARDPGRTLALVSGPLMVPGDAPPPVWVSEPMVDLYGYTLGQRIELPLAGKPVAFTVAGVWRDYIRQQGAIVIERERYVALTGDASATLASLWLAPGATHEQLEAALARTVAGVDKLEISTPGEIRRVSLRVFDRTFAVTYALELATLLIGLFGLSSSFAALVLARRSEFGMLRHIGMTRGQIGAMLATEGCVVSTIGLLVGLVLGGVISFILIFVVNRQSFHWSMDVTVPWSALSVFALVVLTLSTLTALVSGRHAMSEDALRAVKEDW